MTAADVAATSAAGGEVLRVEGLRKDFPLRQTGLRRQGAAVHAVDGVDFTISTGETLGIVGESGCGKSTVARTVLRLLEPTAGRIVFQGEDISKYGRRSLRRVRRDMQMVFQDPYASLNPRAKVRDVVAEPLCVHGVDRGDAARAHVDRLLQSVGLEPEHGDRYPRDFSGGQRQRIGIARALALDPRLLVLDEPVSALDVSIQAQVINLLRSLQRERGLSYLFIAHDLSVVRHICDRVAVMYLGRIVEVGTRQDIFDRPSHPYTQALLSAVPEPEPIGREQRQRIILKGDVPSPSSPPSGCSFRTRCFKAQPICAQEKPELVDRGQGHPTACHFADDALPLLAAGVVR